MARRVDQVEGQAVVLHLNRAGLDRDAALALQIHGVQQLVAEFPLRHDARTQQEPVRERGLSVVHVRNDAEVSEVVSEASRRLYGRLQNVLVLRDEFREGLQGAASVRKSVLLLPAPSSANVQPLSS